MNAFCKFQIVGKQLETPTSKFIIFPNVSLFLNAEQNSLYVCMCAHLCLDVPLHLYVCIQRPEVDVICLFYGFYYFLHLFTLYMFLTRQIVMKQYQCAHINIMHVEVGGQHMGKSVVAMIQVPGIEVFFCFVCLVWFGFASDFNS